MYGSYYGSSLSRSSSSLGAMSGANGVWMIIALVLAIIGGIVLYFTFLAKRNETKFKGFWGWMYDFLSFKKMVIENILRITYLIIALFITLSSFALISINFLSFIIYLVVGNLVIRLTYELSLVVLILCRNTTEINKKLSETKVEEPKKSVNSNPEPINNVEENKE